MGSYLIGTPAKAGGSFAPLAGHWHMGGPHASAPNDHPANGMYGAGGAVLDVTADGRYRFRFEMDEAGLWQAADGKWTRTPRIYAPVSGTYQFDGDDSFTMADANGATIWKRAE